MALLDTLEERLQSALDAVAALPTIVLPDDATDREIQIALATLEDQKKLLQRLADSADAVVEETKSQQAESAAETKTADIAAGVIFPDAPTNCESDQFQGIRFYDGTSFGYLRVFADKVQLLVDQTLEFELDGTKMHTYRLTGKGEDIKLYVDGQLAIDASGKFSQPTATKLIEFGDIAGRNQQIASYWNSFKYTTTGSFSPANTEDLLLEQTIAFPQASVGRLKNYKDALYAAVDPVDPDKSSSIYRFEEGKLPEHRSVLAITRASVSAVVIDPNRSGSIFDTSGKYIGTDNGLQYIIGSKPSPFDFITSFSQPLDGNGWTLDDNCDASCEDLTNGVLTIDSTAEISPRFHRYVQNLPSDSWIENAKNETGWTVETRVKILDDGSGNSLDGKSLFVAGGADDNCGGAVGGPDGLPPPEDSIYAPGVYINDGKYQEIVQFFAKGIRLKYGRIFGAVTLTDQFYTIRIIGKNKAIAVFAKGDNDQQFRRIIFAPNALGVTARASAPQERPDLFCDDAGIIHSVWQESSLDGIAIFYSRLNRTTVVGGSGLIGSKKFDPDNNILDTRPGLGLPPAPDINFKLIGSNTLIAPTASFISKGVKAGDLLQIFEDTGTRSYVVKKVLDEVLVSLDTSDDLSLVGPAEWLIVSGETVWSSPVRVTSEPLDSENPRILKHSSGSVYVAYDNNQSGNTEVYIRRGVVTVQGTNWSQVLKVTSSSHTASTPAVAELKDGSIFIVWKDSGADTTGAQVYYTILPKDLTATAQAFSLTPSSMHARNPRVTTSDDKIIVTYEDDSVQQGKYEVFAVTGTHSPTSNVFSTPVKLSSAFGSAQNSNQAFGTVAWDETFSDGRTEIAFATLTDHATATWAAPIQLSASRGSSRRPTLVSGPVPAATTFIYECDRTRNGYFDLYSAAITEFRDGNPVIPADLRLETYLTNSYRPAAALTPQGRIALVWEGNKDGRQQSIFATTLDGIRRSMDELVLGYFPLDEEIGTTVGNAISQFDNGGFAEPVSSGTGFHAADVYTTTAPKPGVSLFNPADEKAFDFGRTGGDGLNGGFSIETDSFIGKSGAIDMFVTPNWPSSSIDQHVFFGNGPLDPSAPVVPDSIVFGVGPQLVGNVMRLRIVDSLGVPHETLIDDPSLWNIGDTVHLRAVWDATNIGTSTILATHFPSASVGYACGSNGSIFKTTDGGSTWTRQTTGLTYELYAVDFVNATTGFVCGELGTVLVTTDGGASWTVIDTGITADLKGIYFSDASNGVACGSAGAIIRTTNGGLTWTEITTTATNDFNAVAMLSNGFLVAVGHKGQFYVSTDAGLTWASQTILRADGNPVVTSLNAISKTHQGGTYTTYVVGNEATILRTTNNGTSWSDLSTAGPDLATPDLLSVAHGTTSATVWIPWGIKQLAYSTSSADLGTLTFVDTTLNGAYRSVEANFGGTSAGNSALITGIGGNLVMTPNLGVTQNIGKTSCANLTIFVNGKEPVQRREMDCSFLWEPTGKTLYFGDYRQTGRIKAGIPGSTAVDAIMDEVVIYSTPSPGNSAFNRHEFRSKQLAAAPVISDDTGKRIEFGNISSFVKTKTQWREFNMFYCGAIEPLQQFAWNTTCGLVDDVVMDLSLDSSGGLWIATANGISEFDINLASTIISDYLSGQRQPKLDKPLFTNYTNLANNLISDEILSIAVDENGDVWAGTSKGLMLYERSAVVPTASLNDPVNSTTSDTTGTISDGVVNATPAQFVKVEGLPSDNITVVRAVRGAVFVGTDRGLVAIKRTKKTIDPVADTAKDDAAPADAASVEAGATADDIGQPDIVVFNTKDGLPSNRIQSIAQESSGAIWIGTDRGLVLFKGSNSVAYSTKNGLISRDVSSITIDSEDRKFVGTGFGLTLIDGSSFKSYPPSSGIGPGAINGGAQDSSGVLWFATSNGLVEFNESCPTGPRFTTYDLQDGIIGDNRIRDYERYRILGGDIPTGGCNKALVTVAVNGRQLSDGFTVDPFVPWIVFDNPLSASDVVDVCVQRGWRKVHDFNFDRKSNSVNQAVVETAKSKYKLYRKRMSAGSVALGGCFQQGASNTSTMQYSVFAVPLPGLSGPVIGAVSKPTSALALSTVSIGDTLYVDVDDDITTLPQELIEAEHILLSSADAGDVSDDYLNFTLLVDSIVYVAYDSRSGSLPAWLREFEPVPVLIRVSDMEVFTDGTTHEKLFVSTRGSNGCVYDILHDPDICDISDEIAVDVTPPEGCATIAKVNSKTSFTLAINATDAVTGVTDMQIAPRQDGTTDGTTVVPFVPYQTNYTFELPPEASATTGDLTTIPNDTVAGGTTIPPPANIVNNVFHDHLGTLLVGTKNPGRVYVFDQATAKLTLLFDTGEDEVLSMATFGKDLIVGTGITGKAFRWNGTVLTQLPTSVGERVLSAWVFANKVFLGYSPGGEIYTLDQFGIMQLFKDTFETDVTSFATFGGRLFWSTANETVTPDEQLLTTTKKGHKHFMIVPTGTTRLSQVSGITSSASDGHFHVVTNGVVEPAQGHTHGLNGSRSGKIFRYDPGSGQPIIIHADTDYAATALASTSTDTNGILFAGTSPHGKVLRFIPEEEIFIKSFQTTGLTVNRLRYYTKMYALVDSDVYAFTGKRWEFIAAITDTVHDVAPESKSATSTTTGDQILVLRDKHVASTSAAPTLLNPSLCAYVRFKDAAGNVSDVVDSKGALIKCYAPCIDLSGGSGGGGGGGSGDGTDDPGLKIGKNRILEVDSDAKVLFGLDGTEAFLSGNKVEEEVAVYFSEIFNGTNSFVQWTDLSWDGTAPLGTSITFAVRSASTNSGIASALWSPEFTNPTANDLTNLPGQFLQFRATLRSFEIGAPSPVLHLVNIALRTAQAVHYFTTNFVLPDELRKGILTYNGCVNPPVTDVVFGVTGLDSTDFSDYFVIPADKVFDLPSEHQTKNLRVGIKLISSPTEVAIVDEFALLVSLANDAKIKFNLAGQPANTSGQLAPTVGSRTVLTERVQNHTHTITFDASILDKSNINGATSINAGHSHQIINGEVQQAAGHTHNFTI